MNRYLLLGSLASFVLLIGISQAPSYSEGLKSSGLDWVGTELPDRANFEQALEELAASSRWDIESPGGESEVQPREEFNENYKLIAVVDNAGRYALMLPTPLVDEDGAEPRKVFVGDRLSHDWVVTDIQNAAVVATKQDESQRVELFPSH